MRAGKVIAALVVFLVLLASNGITFGLFAADHALSEPSIHKTIEETALIEQTLQEALRENTVNMGGQYEEILSEILKSDAMTDFFTAYMKAAIDTEIYGKPYQEVANDELTRAFSAGIQEVNQAGKVEISALEETLIAAAMAQEIPDLTESLNSAVTHYDTTNGTLMQEAASGNGDLSIAMGKPMRAVVLLVDAVCCVLLIFLFWKSRMGFLWCAVNTGMISAIYMMLSRLESVSMLADAEGSLADQFLLHMASKGFLKVAIVGFIITAIWIVLCIVFRRCRRKRQNLPAAASGTESEYV